MTNVNEELPADVKQAIAKIAETFPSKPATKPKEQEINGPIPPEVYPTTSLQKSLEAAGARTGIAFPDVRNDYELDNAIIGQTVTSNGCMVQAPWVSSVLRLEVRSVSAIGTIIGTGPSFFADVPMQLRPVVAYLSYIKKDSVPTGVHESYTLRKKKGFTRQFATSVEMRASTSVGIFGCEASLEVTTAFSYSETITEEKEEEWHRSVTGPVDLWTFQPVLVYAYKIPQLATLNIGDALQRVYGSLYYSTSSDLHYVFVPVFRNTPSVVDREIGYLALSDVVQYLCNAGWHRW